MDKENKYFLEDKEVPPTSDLHKMTTEKVLGVFLVFFFLKLCISIFCLPWDKRNYWSKYKIYNKYANVCM